MEVSPGTCVVVGGGPAGMIASLLLARAGVEVTVLEKHRDFLRDFRGDTVHASTLTLLDELGLGEQFARLPARYLVQAGVDLDAGHVEIADLRRLPGAHQHIALVPQWDFLELVAAACRAEPTHRLLMGAEVVDVLGAARGVHGVRYRHNGTEQELAADLVVACDGRTSAVRTSVGRRAREFGVPIDVLWFRLPRHDDDPIRGLGRLTRGAMVVLIDRGDYFQLGYLIKKGTDADLRAAGLEAFRDRLVEALPWLADRVEALDSMEDVKLLSVQISRLRRWWAPGLLFIGDAAHAMSPVGGVGINLAVQDAVAAARRIGPRLASRRLRTLDLAAVQARRWLPTAITQFGQRLAHRYIVGGGPLGRGRTESVPPALRLLQRFPRLRGVPAYAVAIGLLPEHAPAWGRRSETPEATSLGDRLAPDLRS
ncbi:MAG: FAD-dependent oxidoreductase [Microlunatus sp.]|nr:FAD-dependent oxidoreductase [Microlunatus sp.]